MEEKKNPQAMLKIQFDIRVSPLSPSGSSGMFPSTQPCLDLSHGSLLEPFLQVKIHKYQKNCQSWSHHVVFTEQFSFSAPLHRSDNVWTAYVSNLLVLDYYKRCACYHLQSKWTGPFVREVEKLIMLIRMVSDSF